MILINLKAHRMGTNLPKENSSVIIDVENEPPPKKQRSITCYLKVATKILVWKESLEAGQWKVSQRHNWMHPQL